MYYKIQSLMRKNKITYLSMANCLNLTRDTLSKKIYGKAKFTVDELLAIKENFFPDVSLDELVLRVD